MRTARTLALALPLLLACACAVDDRRLSRGSGSGGSGSDSDPGAQGGEGDVGNSGSSASGGRPNPSGLIDGCADLDTDGVADCKTNLIENATFEMDVEGWQAANGTELSWDDKNTFADLPSGCAGLKAATGRARAQQCVNVPAGQLLIAYANAFVSGEAGLGQAALNVSFFKSADCNGESPLFFETPPSTVTGSWVVVHAGALAPPDVASVSIELVGIKPDGADEIRVFFDNVMLKTKDVM